MSAFAVRTSRLLPSTLFGRLVASLLIVVAVTLVVGVLLVLQDRRELTMRVGGIGDSSRKIAEITRALEPLDPKARDAECARLSADETLWETVQYRREPVSRLEVAAIKRAFTSELRERLGEGYIVDVHRAFRNEGFIRLVERQHRQSLSVLDVSVKLPDRYMLIFRVATPLPDPPLPWTLFAQLAALTFGLVLALFLVTRSITRPLSNLARAADAVGRSVRQPPVAEEGVREIREATRAFNTMQDRLLRYLDSRTSVLAAMSHDLRTPLTQLRLRVETVPDAQLRSRFGADLDEMEGLVHGALALFKGLNDEEAVELLDVNLLLRTIVAEYIEVGANMSFEGAADDLVKVKPRALKRCLTNLIDNALKFGKRAMIRIEDAEALVITVSDDGPGIPEVFLERVFEPFYRLEVSRSRDTGGTGLGLSIARDVAQSHGGTLTLRNRPEGGLIADLRLPKN